MAAGCLKRFIAEECANHVTGRCVMHRDGACLVVADKRCAYFESSVFPIAARGLRMACKPPKDDTAVVVAYHAIAPLATPAGTSVRRCPDCSTPLPPRCRYCAACARKRRRKAQRECHARRRMPVNS